MVSQTLFSSKSDEWETPQKLFYELDQEFDFYVDLAATKENTKCPFWLDDSLNQPWHTVKSHWMWLNPPYSKSKEFIKKAYEESLKGANIVMLLPARTDTKAFHDYIYKKPNVIIRFLKGRLKFGNAKNSAPFPSMVVIFKGILFD
jgi:phage N-6-adenine-methyltransferase